MNIAVISMYVLFSLILFFLLNYIEQSNKENPVNRIIISLIYMIILSGFIKSDFIFLILIFEFLIRIFYTNYIEERDFFKESSSLKEYLITFVLGYLLNAYFINNVDSVFLSVSEFKIILWLFIIVFFYLMINNNLKEDLQRKSKKREKRNKEVDIIAYARIKNQYADVISVKNEELVPFIYAMMIYNNYNKPKLYRKLDIVRFRIDNEPRRMGIMQIESKKIINDEESINLGIKKIEKLYLKYSKDFKLKLESIFLKILNDYYDDKDISKEILEIYNKIIEFNKK